MPTRKDKDEAKDRKNVGKPKLRKADEQRQSKTT